MVSFNSDIVRVMTQIRYEAWLEKKIADNELTWRERDYGNPTKLKFILPIRWHRYVQYPKMIL